ncbi:hypothetical protein RFI_23202 [Reticulomyxa filosa]|uniref:Uncharacterized protein n=1 Tax=Reticulomyxa filosa TaxID=46433 RepID=X6MJH3_RETFI|nr:hypothetical protein RFI_23202 [Reticulomyxa filosa]|eukprot:ETO14163.1 hypothetical protein RFI_23202 [Reticulomyxa filosa]
MMSKWILHKCAGHVAFHSNFSHVGMCREYVRYLFATRWCSQTPFSRVDKESSISAHLDPDYSPLDLTRRPRKSTVNVKKTKKGNQEIIRIPAPKGNLWEKSRSLRKKILEKKQKEMATISQEPTSEITRKRVFSPGERCQGCGIMLQNENESLPGYVTPIGGAKTTSDNSATKPREISRVISSFSSKPNSYKYQIKQESNEESASNVYIPDHQKLVLMDSGIMDPLQTNLTDEQLQQIRHENEQSLPTIDTPIQKTTTTKNISFFFFESLTIS